MRFLLSKFKSEKIIVIVICNNFFNVFASKIFISWCLPTMKYLKFEIGPIGKKNGKRYKIVVLIIIIFCFFLLDLKID